MLTRQEYLQNPCRASALPYWKLCAGNLPEGVEVIHEKEAGKRIGDVSTAVECYFRLFHHLDTLSIDSHSEIVLQTAWKEVNVFAEIINASYPDLRVSEAQLLQLQAQACFSPEGWVVALDRQSGKPLACGIAALDRQMQEISLEWNQDAVPSFTEDQYRALCAKFSAEDFSIPDGDALSSPDQYKLSCVSVQKVK